MARKPKPSAASQPAVIAYKGFDEDWKCRGFQYEMGQTYTHDGPIVRCGAGGFHACENPFDVLSYYGLTDSKFAIVEMDGDIARATDGDTKIAAARITIQAELTLPEFITSAVNWLVKHVALHADGTTASGYGSKLAATGDGSKLAASGYGSKLAASGDRSQLAASGDGSQLAATGDGSQLAATGYSSKLAASGDRSKLAASGYGSKLAATGDGSQLAATGYSSQLAATGDGSQLAASGYGSVIAVSGIDALVTIGKNGAAAIAYHDGKRIRFITIYEGEDGIEAGVAYHVVDGKAVKVED